MLLLLVFVVSTAMAVDPKKFRTCQQTSFCRRHRDAHSARLYDYELIKDSIVFHHPAVPGDHHQAAAATATAAAAAAGDEGSKNNNNNNMWTSISRRLLGNKDDSNNSDNNSKTLADPYVQGPPPTLTGVIINNAPETSLAHTGEMLNTEERLAWSVYALPGGVVRMRVTEPYSSGSGSSGSTPFEKARVTYDQVVLDQADTWLSAQYSEWINPTAVAAADGNTQHKQLLQQLVSAATADKENNKNQDVNIDNYVALKYGDDDNSKNVMILLVHLKPFAVYLFRQEADEKQSITGPIVVLGAESMMSFEIRRLHPEDEAAQQAAAAKEAAAAANKEKKAKDAAAMAADAEAEAAEHKAEKDIVGYWEDGLAIYADGTREQPKEKPEEDIGGDEEGGGEHRKLSESELDREGLWEEKFHEHVDSKPYGPMSVGMDITFPKSMHVYGIPEHASSTVLQTTLGDDSHYKDPYRLYTLDVFEYDLDVPMALYGVVPMVVSQSSATGTTGVFWFNPTETFVDVMQKRGTTTTHWMSESGIIDVFLMPGPDPHSLYRQYAKLTGTTPLPPMFGLGYHQCRWNYKDEKDVYHVHGKFEELDYPYDVLWLDIEHTDGKRYFTWDKNLFPNPETMIETLAAQGRRMVTIIDPHIKRDDGYYIHKEATAKGLYVKKNDDKTDYDGWCWPGSSSYLDFTKASVRQWWAEQFSYKKYKGSTPTLFTWNDMNEPSVFNGPEVSMQKDLKNLAGDEHREWHNLYGMLFHRATGEGQILRNEQVQQDFADVHRPFVLSRSFFAGSQRYGAIWTGDNAAEWSHLEIAAPMLLSLNIAALSFVGADVGGFFGNPSAELFTRWMQAGAYQPFFRGHAHHDSKRREPWMFDEETLVRLRRSAMTRYALLPFWYTVFYEAEVTGMPVMRMMWMQYPHAESLFGMDDQYMIGADLLVHPVVKAGATEVDVAFPAKDVWYNVETLVVASSEGGADDKAVVNKKVPADIDTIPAYQRGGSIIPRKLRLRRSSMTMKTDPYTFYVALDRTGRAMGRLYMDDEETFGYKQKSEFAIAELTADLQSGGSNASLDNVVKIGAGWTSNKKGMEELAKDRMIERFVIMGVQKSPSTITIEGDVLEFDFNNDSKTLVIRKPSVSAMGNWTMLFS
jgi:mannosyl-oligosaccharide alpha-1,3-glucosidase